MSKKKKMRMSNEAFCEMGCVRIKCRLHPEKYPRLSQNKAGPTTTITDSHICWPLVYLHRCSFGRHWNPVRRWGNNWQNSDFAEAIIEKISLLSTWMAVWLSGPRYISFSNPKLPSVGKLMDLNRCSYAYTQIYAVFISWVLSWW